MARGLSARTSGDRFVSESNNSHWIDFNGYQLYPTDRPKYETAAELNVNMQLLERKYGCSITWENNQRGQKAAYITFFHDEHGMPRMFGKYVRKNPMAVPDGMWTKITGYSLVGNIDVAEFFPIQPTDLLTDNQYTLDELCEQLKESVTEKTANTEFSDLGTVIITMIDQARSGDFGPIPGAEKYKSVLEKTAGEYLGIISLLSGTCTGDVDSVKKRYRIKDFSKFSAVFPDDKAYPLVDSILTARGKTIQISSKAHKGNGAASVITSLVKFVTPEIEDKYTHEVECLKTLAFNSIQMGPLILARDLKLISKKSFDISKKLMSGETDVINKELTNILSVINADTDNEKYQVKFHLLSAIVTKLMNILNTTRMSELGMELLKQTNYVQLLAHGKKEQAGYYQTYYVKDPESFKGTFELKNKSYWAANAIARIGFKMVKEK